jgi:hypothetical protein
MYNRTARMLCSFLATAFLWGAPPRPAPPPPALLPGEALVLAGPDREVFRYGDAATESPMGTLSQLLWVRLEGDAWASEALDFKCRGTVGPFTCSEAKGHGRVDLAGALQRGCTLSFMAWSRMSLARWADLYGEGAARARMLEVFQPFLGWRMPAGGGQDVPELTPAWFGEGDMLRTSPDALLNWLIDPAQEEVVRLYRRLLLSFYDETFKENAWWFAVAAPGAPATAQGWAVGGNGVVVVVLRLPPGTTRDQARTRFQTIMVGKKPKK